MANSVDNRVVRMEFDNAGFQQKISETAQSIKNLDDQLRLQNGEKGLKGVQQAAQNIGLDKVAADVETLNSKFSVFGVAAATAISNITNRVMAMGEKMISAITIDPIKDGFKEYELQLSSVQTILMNTRKHGTTMKDVTATLAELNKYADQTVYNFGDMTRSIGQFTQAGVNLEDSTTAIKGMSNLAAGFNVDNAKLQNAMYQMSQALSAGKVQLMDWRSMLNAGMGGEALQEAFRKVSEEMGTGAEAAIAKQGSFNESLREGWLTTEVAIETFNRFTKEGAAGHGKWWEEQAAAFEDAATKIKTFPQLIDVVKEELGSGWATSWQYIMGDFEEAQELFTAIGTPITNFVSQIHDARNEVLKFWHDVQEGQEFSGRDYFLQGLGNIVEAIHSIVAPIGDAFAEIFSTVDYVEDKFGNTTAQLSGFGKEVAQGLVDASKAFADFTAGLKMGEGYYGVVKNIFTTLFNGLKGLTTVLGGAFSVAAKVAGVAIDGFAFALNLVFNVINTLSGPIFTLIGQGFNKIGEVITSVMDALAGTGISLEPVAKFIQSAANAIAQFLRDLSEGKPVAEAFQLLLNKLSVQADALGRAFGPAFEKVGEFLSNLGNSVKQTAIDAYTKALELFGIASEKAGQSAEKAKEAVGGLLDKLSGAGSGLSSFFSGAASANAESASEASSGLSGLGKSSAVFGDFGSKASDGLHKATDAFSEFMSTIDRADVFKVVSAAFAGFMAFNVIGLIKNIKGLTDGFGSLGKHIKGFTEGLLGIPGTIEETIKSFGGYYDALSKAAKLKAAAEVIKSVAIAIGVLAASLFLLSMVKPERLQSAALVLGGIIGTIALAGALLSHFSPAETIAQFKELLAACTGLVAIGGALTLIAVAAKIFASMDYDELVRGLGAIATTMLILVVAAKALAKGLAQANPAAMVKFGVSIFILANAIGTVAAACLLFNFVDPMSMLKAWGALIALVGATVILSKVSHDTGSFIKLALSMQILGLALAELGVVCLAFTLVPLWGIFKAALALVALVAAAKSMAKIGDVYAKSIIPVAGALAILGAAMIELAIASAIFSTLDPEGMIKAGIALGAMLGALYALSVTGDKYGKGLGAMAAALPMIAVGMGVLAVAVAMLGSLPWQVLLFGLAGLAAGLAIICGAGFLAGIPQVALGLIVLSESIAMIGVGIGAAGLGFIALAAGLATLAAVAPAGCEAIVHAFIALGEGIFELFARIGVAIVNGVLSMTKALADATPQFIAAGQRLLVSWKQIVSSGLILEMGRVAGAMLVQFLAGIGEMVGALVAGGAAMIVQVLLGIAQHLGEVIEAGVQVAISFINGLANALRNNSGPIWDAIGNLLTSVLIFIEEGLIRFVEQIPVIGTDAANQLRSWSGLLGPAAQEVSDATANAADPSGKIASKYSTEMGEVNAAIESGGAEANNSLFSMLGDAVDMAGAELPQIPAEMSDAMSQSSTVIDSAQWGDITGGQAKDAVSAFRSEIKGLADTSTDAVSAGLKALTSADFGGPAKKQGSDAAAGFESGINPSKWRAAGAKASASASAGIGSSNLYQSGYNTGGDIGDGLVAGVKDKVDDAYQAGYALGQAAVKGKKDGSGSHSPSVYAIQTGHDIGDGLVIGLHHMLHSVYNAGKELGSSASTAVSLAAEVMDLVDWNADPVITPVLDTSNIDAGMARIFGGAPQIEASYVASKYALSSGTDASVSGVNDLSAGAQYNFYLQYDAGTDATQMVRDMTVAIKNSNI